MNIQCECGAFEARIDHVEKSVLGRMVCYCDDCQTYLHVLERTDLLDSAGGTEIIAVYPSDFHILKGADQLACTRLSSKGLFRWWVRCCRTPIGNTLPRMPWIGLIHRVFTVKDSQFLDQNFGPVLCRFQGRYAQGLPPPGTSKKATLKDLSQTIPFLVKGLFLRKGSPSPFFGEDGKTPVVQPEIVDPHRRQDLLQLIHSRILK